MLNRLPALDAKDGFTGAELPTDPKLDWVITSVSANPTLLISTDFAVAIGQDRNLYDQLFRVGTLRYAHERDAS
jgi:hypothetical protein